MAEEPYCAARPQEEGRYAACKIRRAGGMKIAVEYSKRGNIAAKTKAQDFQLEERSW